MERWQLSQKELARYGVIENTIERYLKVNLAAEELYLSKRQVFRLKKIERERNRVDHPWQWRKSIASANTRSCDRYCGLSLPGKVRWL